MKLQRFSGTLDHIRTYHFAWLLEFLICFNFRFVFFHACRLRIEDYHQRYLLWVITVCMLYIYAELCNVCCRSWFVCCHVLVIFSHCVVLSIIRWISSFYQISRSFFACLGTKIRFFFCFCFCLHFRRFVWTEFMQNCGFFYVFWSYHCSLALLICCALKCGLSFPLPRGTSVLSLSQGGGKVRNIVLDMEAHANACARLIHLHAQIEL